MPQNGGGGVWIMSFTAVVKEVAGWWIGWIEEIPGVNSRSRIRDELVDNLRSALEEAIELHRAEARAAADACGIWLPFSRMAYAEIRLGCCVDRHEA